MEYWKYGSVNVVDYIGERDESLKNSFTFKNKRGGFKIKFLKISDLTPDSLILNVSDI